MTDDRERCESCRFWNYFWKSSQNGDPKKGTGRCQKLTPSFWTQTSGADWCGEWSANEEERKSRAEEFEDGWPF